MTVTPSRAGMAPDRLQRLDHWLQRDYIDTGRLPGAQLLVARHGEVVHQATLGRMDVERDRPLRDDALWRIYSMTKPITSVALMMLWEEGRFTLNDPVHRFIPAWRDLRVWEAGRGELMRTRPARQPMTMRHILSHTAGLTYGSALLAPGQQAHPVEEAYAALNIGTRSGDTLAQMVDKLARVPLRFDPGSAWQYSLATDVCGHLVQVISGQPFERFVHERILAPMGMVDTGFHVPADQLDRLTTCYRYDAQRLMVPVDSPERSAFAPPPVNGAESLVTTLAASGVGVCFTNPGTSEMHFVAALDRIPGVRCVLGLFEGVVTGAADGYWRMAGTPGGHAAAPGPGPGQRLANLHNARKARSGIVNIVGDHATGHVRGTSRR
jgi:CubicO group peptidase (beta-lactamase class C family)